jgi:two-component system, OmpR family, response regulator
MNAANARGELSHVLCVEDDPHLRELLQLALETVGGLKVTLRERGDQTIDAVNTAAPDLLLLDVQLPGMDGPTILRALRSAPSTEALPVIFMTGTHDPHELQRLRASGVLEVLVKPFDPLSLAARLRALWAQDR